MDTDTMTRDPQSGLYSSGLKKLLAPTGRVYQKPKDIASLWNALRNMESGAVTAPGYYGLTLEVQLRGLTTEDLEAEDNKELMVTDSEVPNFLTHDFRDDIAAEITGTNYTAGGVALTTTDITLATTILTFDAQDTLYSNITITSGNAMAGVIFFNVGTAATDNLVCLQDFVTDADATAADFTIQHHVNGIFTIDFSP